MSWENFNLESELKSINEISARGLTTWKDKLIDRYKQHSEEAEMIWTTIENDIKLNNSWRTCEFSICFSSFFLYFIYDIQILQFQIEIIILENMNLHRTYTKVNARHWKSKQMKSYVQILN